MRAFDKFKYPQIAPSLLSASFQSLGPELREVENAGAEIIHLDIMDGHFVPNLTIGPPVVASLRKESGLLFDVHLMVTEPEKWLEPFSSAGADSITFHVEACRNPTKIISEIRKLNKCSGISLSPDTPIEAVLPYLELVDVVLVMSVHPGFGGQKFIPSALDKVRDLAQFKEKSNFLIEVDGGVNDKCSGELLRAGCDILVAGTAVFGEKDRKRAMEKLRRKS